MGCDRHVRSRCNIQFSHDASYPENTTMLPIEPMSETTRADLVPVAALQQIAVIRGPAAGGLDF